MRTVWKQVIRPDSVHNDLFTIEVVATKGADILFVGKQGNDVCVWFECDPKAVKRVVKLYCLGTGFGGLPDKHKLRYVSTVVDGGHVWHFYTRDFS